MSWIITRRGSERDAQDLSVHPRSIASTTAARLVRGHVLPRDAAQLHPEAAAFAAHSGFVIDVVAAARPGLTHASRRRA